MDRQRIRRAIVGAAVSVVGSTLLSVCVLTIGIFGLAWSQGFEYASGIPIWAVPIFALIYAIGNTIRLAYYALLPIAIIGAIVGYFWRRS